MSVWNLDSMISILTWYVSLQLEAKVHYDMSVTHRNPYRPPWYRRLLFVGGLVGAAAWFWRRSDQDGFDRSLVKVSEVALVAYANIVEFFTSKHSTSQVAVTLR